MRYSLVALALLLSTTAAGADESADLKRHIKDPALRRYILDSYELEAKQQWKTKIHWRKSLTQAIVDAKRSGKPILVHVLVKKRNVKTAAVC